MMANAWWAARIFTCDFYLFIYLVVFFFVGIFMLV
jgi:hypothetical protein